MHLEVFDETKSQIWNTIIGQSRNGTLFHTWEWLKIMEKHYHSQLLPLVFFDADDDKAFGAIPLFFMKKLGLKMVFSPPPGTAVTLGPVLIDKSYRQHKFELAYQDFESQIDIFIKNLNVNYTNILTSPGLLDVRPFMWAGYQINPSYTYKTDLDQGEKVLWNNLSRHMRQAINRTQNRGVYIIQNDFENGKEIDYIYESLFRRYGEQRLKLAVKKSYLENVLRQFGGSSAKVYLAAYDGNSVGWQLLILYKDTVYGWLGSVRSESNSLEINGLSWWKIIAQAANSGYKWLVDMGANTPNICSYKSKFSPAVEVCFEMKKTDFWGNLAEKVYYLRKGSHTGKYEGLRLRESK